LPSERLTICVDANVFISALAFGGKPQAVVNALFEGRCVNVTSAQILTETARNLEAKLGQPAPRVQTFIQALAALSRVVEVRSVVNVTGHTADDAVLATAVLGRCDVLVTGDKRHLLPLGRHRSVTIEAPSAFLKRFESR
jgi:putative PIN family toxin of toxin-antitoxin system